MKATQTSQVVVVNLAILLLLLTSYSTEAQQNNQARTPEEIAFRAVSDATSAAARVAAAEDFIAGFPQSSKRPSVARLVAEQITTLRNPQIAISLVERARAIFTLAEELKFFKPAALEIYAKGDRPDEAFQFGSELLSQKPNEFWILERLTYLGARQARNKNLKYAEVALQYGLRAIEIIEKDQKANEITEAVWHEEKSKLPALYQQVAIIKLAQGKPQEAKAHILKATQLGPKDPSNFAFLGRLLNEEYEQMTTAYEAMPEGSAKQDERKRLNTLLDEIIDVYARAAGLATGKVEYQTLLQQLIPDLTRYYKYRNNQSIVGLRTLIEKYRYQ
jgi:tetratricopeptide (TPR) repeat protein